MQCSYLTGLWLLTVLYALRWMLLLARKADPLWPILLDGVLNRCCLRLNIRPRAELLH